MKDRKGTLIALLFIACVIVVLLAVDKDRRSSVTLRQEMVNFQRAIGGVGLGAVVVPAWNFHDYDPRLQQSPYDSLYPIPAGYSYSPDRLSMVTSFAVDK